MKTSGTTIGKLVAVCALACCLTSNIHAQTAVAGNFNSNLSLIQTAAPDSIVQITADAQGLSLVSPGQAPRSGTFWWIMPGGNAVPAPCPPLDLTAPIFQIAPGQFVVDETSGAIPASPRRFGMQAQTAGSTAISGLEMEADTVLNLITRVQTTSASQQMRMMAGGTMSMDVPSFNDIGNGDTNTSFSFNDYSSLTNGLWLELTNISNGYAWLNLHNATDVGGVYEIFSKTNLAAPSWNIAAALWPTDTNCTPFVLSLNPQPSTFFVWSRDWTGVTSGGNQTPEWWFWKYFGTVDLLDSTTDSSGYYSLLYDYNTGADPNVIQFSIQVANNYVTTSSANLSLNVTAGTPSYYAVLVNDTNAADANWQPYTTSNTVVYLGASDGPYNVSVGLRGLPPDAQQTWEGVTFARDTAAAEIVLTNLAGFTGSRPFIDPAGYTTKSLSSLTFNVTNSLGAAYSDQGTVVDQDCNPNDMNHATNRFVCLDVALTLGTNYIGIHAVDWAGNVTTTNFSYIFDTNGDTTPPAIAMSWPQDGMEISGNSLTLRGTLDDDTATVSGQWTDTNGVTQTVNGLVERGGRFWLENMPLNPGTNIITITATDAAGNPATNTLTLVQSGVTLTMDTVDVSQLNQVQVNVTGEISDPTYAVWVNGVQGTNNGDGTWLADNVPVTSGGTASFDMTAYPPGYAPTGNSWTNFADEMTAYPNPLPADPVQSDVSWDKPPVVYTKSMTENFSQDWSYSWWNPSITNITSETINWSQGGGGSLSFAWSEGPGSTVTLDASWQADPGYVPSLPGNFHYVDYQNTHFFADTNITASGSPFFRGYHGLIVPFNSYTHISGSGTYSIPISYSVEPEWSETVQQVVKLFTGGKALRQSKSLFVLNQALYWSTGEGFDWDQYDDFGDVPPKQIVLDALGTLGDDGNLYTAQANGQNVAITPRTTQPYSLVSGALPSQQKYTPVSQTYYPALTDTNRNRTSLGVGEQVSLYFTPTPWFVFDWTTTAGGLSEAMAADVVFTAPSNATANVTVTTTIRGGKSYIFPPFKVVEPINATSIIESNDTYTAGEQGAGMHLLVTWHPTDVSFYRVQMLELPGPATNITGYFTNYPATNLWHFPNPNWILLTPQNNWKDHTECSGFPPPWIPGGFDRDIPIQWEIVGSTNIINFPHELSQKRITATDGTTTVTKLGSSTTRTP